MATLYELDKRYRNIEELFADETIEKEDLFDALDALEGEIVEKMLNTARYIKNEEAEIVGIKSEVERLNDRAKARERKIERMKQYMLETMRNYESDKIQDTLFTVSLQLNPPKVVIEDEKIIPFMYKVTRPAEVSRAAIKRAIEAGENVPGARLVQEQSLRIR